MSDILLFEIQQVGTSSRVGWMGPTAPPCTVDGPKRASSSARTSGTLDFKARLGEAPATSLYLVRAAQRLRPHPVGPFQVPLRCSTRPLDSLRSNHPAQRSLLLADCILQQIQALHECVRPRRAAGNVHVHRKELVHALDDTADIVHAP